MLVIKYRHELTQQTAVIRQVVNSERFIVSVYQPNAKLPRQTTGAHTLNTAMNKAERAGFVRIDATFKRS